MKIYREIIRKEQQVYETYCNKCGKELYNSENENIIFDFPHEFEIIFGYGSSLDGDKWNFDLCSDCIIELVETFQIPVEKEILY